MEGDALYVVILLNSDSSDLSERGVLIQDTKQLQKSTASWSAKQVPRNLNMVAHTLAKSATKIVLDVYAVDHIPVCIYQFVSMDDIDVLLM